MPFFYHVVAYLFSACLRQARAIFQRPREGGEGRKDNTKTSRDYLLGGGLDTGLTTPGVEFLEGTGKNN